MSLNYKLPAHGPGERGPDEVMRSVTVVLSWLPAGQAGAPAPVTVVAPRGDGGATHGKFLNLGGGLATS